jgi:molybdopterin converting factor subunit 1
MECISVVAVKVRFFASLAEQVGRREAECEHYAGLTAAGVWRELTGQAELPEGVMCAVNHDYCEAGSGVNDADELAFFPPVTGG